MSTVVRQRRRLARFRRDASAQGVQFGFSGGLAMLRGDPGDLPAGWAEDLDNLLAGPARPQEGRSCSGGCGGIEHDRDDDLGQRSVGAIPCK
jgi:hypothetical protein